MQSPRSSLTESVQSVRAPARFDPAARPGFSRENAPGLRGAIPIIAPARCGCGTELPTCQRPSETPRPHARAHQGLP